MLKGRTGSKRVWKTLSQRDMMVLQQEEMSMEDKVVCKVVGSGTQRCL